MTATAADKPVFVGVARTSQVDTYLRGVSHDEVTDFEVDPLSVSYDRRAGSAEPSAPGNRSFWAASSSGSGTRTLTWPVEEGAWSVVVMNADGSPGVQTDVSVGAKVGLLLWLGVGLLAFGVAVAVGAAAAIYHGVRSPQQPAQAGATPLGAAA